jgi:glycosyltransferase involved in cell wall biosynthesis
MKPKISIIIPTLNEEENIAKVLCLIPPRLAKNSEVLVIDSSTDTTPLIAKRMGARVIRVARKGKGRAMKVGVRRARGDVLVFLDGDGSYDPRFIPKLVKKLERADLVLGCRGIKEFNYDDPRWKHIYQAANYLWNVFFRPVGISISEPLTGFRALRRTDWERLALKSDHFEIEAEMNISAVKEGFRIVEVAVPNLKRRGKSKFLRDPQMWFKILNLISVYFREEKVKKQIREVSARLSQLYEKIKLEKIRF